MVTFSFQWIEDTQWTLFASQSGDGAGKGRRACNYVYVSGILISESKKSIQNADWQGWLK